MIIKDKPCRLCDRWGFILAGLEIILNNKKFAFMATPIKITPVLKDESSHRFNKMLVAQQNQKVSQEEKKRIASLVASVLANSKLSK